MCNVMSFDEHILYCERMKEKIKEDDMRKMLKE